MVARIVVSGCDDWRCCMSSWSDSDRETLREAVASGVLTVSYAGPPARTITYQNLDAMRRLLSEMDRQVSTAPRTRYAIIDRGF